MMIAFSSSVSVLLSLAFLLNDEKFQAEAKRCSNDSDCSSIYGYCCKQRGSVENICIVGGCHGQPCSFNSDCGRATECCRSNLCTRSGCYTATTPGINICYYNSDCSFNTYCCKKRFNYEKSECRSGCIGLSCSTNSDCGGPRECCRLNRCTRLGCKTSTTSSPPYGCTSNSYCNYNKYCCKKRYYYERSECRYNCAGQSCSSSDDCGGPNECCRNRVCTALDCKSNGTKTSSSLAISSVVSGVVFGVIIPVAIIVCCYRRCCSTSSNQPRRRAVVVRERRAELSVISVQKTQIVQNSPPQLQIPHPVSHFNQGQNLAP